MASTDENKIDNDNTFDFEKWIQSSELEPVKSLMIKHNLITIDSLSLTSPQYIQLLSDILSQQKQHFIPKINQAIQSLLNAKRIQSLDDCIVISEAEKSVMDKLKQYSIELDEREKDIKELREQYPQSIKRINKERDTQIEQAQKTINNTFNKIKDELSKRQQQLLNELSQLKEGNINIDDMKIELFDEVTRAVKSQNNKIANNYKLCEDTVIRQKNKGIDKRKEFILNVGNKCDKEFNLQIESIEKNKQKIQELINTNNEYCVNISYNINENTYNELLTRIHNLGVIENCEHKETAQYTKDFSGGFPITDDLFEEKDNKANDLKVEGKQLCDMMNEWKQKYDKKMNTFNINASNKLQLYENKYTHLMNSMERCKQKFDILTKETQKWEKKHNELNAKWNKKHNELNVKWQKKHNELNTKWQKQNNFQAKETQKWQTKYNNLNESISAKHQTAAALKWQKKHNESQKTYNELEAKWQKKYNETQAKWQGFFDKRIVKSLGFSANSKYRWCKEEKEQYIPVKILDTKENTYITSKGMMKSVDEVSCQMSNTVSATEICKWLSVMKQSYESSMNIINWRFDHWNSQLKHEYIEQLTEDVIATSSNLVWFRSIFGSQICKPSFRYHWKLEQQTESPVDFYVGIEKVTGEQLIETYFYKSPTSYAFSGHNHTLYANGNLTNDKCNSHNGKCCSKKGDIIDVYLELDVEHYSILSYTVNGKKCAKAYVKSGEYRLAVCMNGISRIKLVYSSKRDGGQHQEDDQEEDQTEFV